MHKILIYSGMRHIFIYKNSLHRTIIIHGFLVALLLLSWPSDLAAQQTGTEEVPPPPIVARLPFRELQDFVQVFDYIRKDFVEPTTDRMLLESAIKGMVHGLDPHSDYLGPDDYRYLQNLSVGQVGGIGIEVSNENGQITIITPLDDTPAQQAGLLAGDIILRMNSVSVAGMSLSEVARQTQGAPGTILELLVARPGVADPIGFSLERTLITLSSVRSRILAPGIGYLRVSEFQKQTGSEIRQALTKMETDEKTLLAGLILDLRNNPGGVLEASTEVADIFLTGGEIVSIRSRKPELDQTYHAVNDNESLPTEVPIVVLINAGTASAAEIVAGAMQAHRRAVLLGESSFGKGSVQTLIPLLGGGAIKLTTAYYHTPQGHSIQARGIIPDIPIVQKELPIDPVPPQQEQREADLPGHLTEPGQAIAGTGFKLRDEVAAMIAKDYQLYEALTLLRGLVIVAKRRESREAP